MPNGEVPASVYIAYDIDDQPLYVGCTTYLPKRLAEHSRYARWWSRMHRIETIDYPTSSAAQWNELLLIQELRPPFNRRPAGTPPRPPKPLKGPSERDKKIARLRADGWTWRQISEELGITPTTMATVARRLRWQGQVPYVRGVRASSDSPGTSP
jgi:DNA-binding NarL/FixJ family response regulator